MEFRVRRHGNVAGEAPFDSHYAGYFQHVEADHSVVVHDDTVVGLDESHASHISRHVENMLTRLYYLLAVVIHPQVNQVELIAEHLLLQQVPVVKLARDFVKDYDLPARTPNGWIFSGLFSGHLPACAHSASSRTQRCSDLLT